MSSSSMLTYSSREYLLVSDDSASKVETNQ